MTHNIQKFNAVSDKILNTLIDHYVAAGSYATESMNKLPANLLEYLITPIIEVIADKELTYAGGNFYKHTVPYLPHTDYQPRDNNILNVVIPMQYTESLPNLIVFDQTWEQSPVTWSMHHEVQSFTVNIGVKGCPYEYSSIKNLTGKEIDHALLQYLNHYPKHCLFGLSGSAYPFVPGSAILFDNRKIHCTSSFTGTKLGLSLRYRDR